MGCERRVVMSSLAGLMLACSGPADDAPTPLDEPDPTVATSQCAPVCADGSEDTRDGTTTGDDPHPGRGGGERDSGDVGPPDVGPTVEPPSLHFVDVTSEAGLEFDPGDPQVAPWCLLDWVDGPGPGDYCLPQQFLGAVAVGDFDGDDWPDVFFTRVSGRGLLMRNRGDGTFEEVAEAVGIHQTHITGGAAWLDLEGDGDLDLLLTSFGGVRHYLYVNRGRGSFEERAVERGLAVDTGAVHVGTSIGIGDYDLDGFVDVFVGEWQSTNALGPGPDHNRLLHNRGVKEPGYFDDVTDASGIDLSIDSPPQGTPPGAFGFAPAFVDLDGDRWPELAIAADYGTSRLFWNEAGAFIDGTASAGLLNDAHGMGSALGDFDGDGRLDWFISAIHIPQVAGGNRLYRNQGDRTFTEITDEVGVRDGGWGWGAVPFDGDGDGDLDLALASGWPSSIFSDDPVRLWLNDPQGAWPQVALALGLDFTKGGRGLVTFDYDRDGDLDVLVHANTDSPALFRNDTQGHGWLMVRAVGQGGNARGIGAKIRVQTRERGPWQVRHIGVGSHLFGQEDAVAHFGLGAGSDPVHRVEVEWPTSDTTVLTDVARDQVLTISQ
jgi:hypothetical protein